MQSLRNARTSQVLIICFVNERTSIVLSTMKHCVLDENYGSVASGIDLLLYRAFYNTCKHVLGKTFFS